MLSFTPFIRRVENEVMSNNHKSQTTRAFNKRRLTLKVGDVIQTNNVLVIQMHSTPAVGDDQPTHYVLTQPLGRFHSNGPIYGNYWDNSMTKQKVQDINAKKFNNGIEKLYFRIVNINKGAQAPLYVSSQIPRLSKGVITAVQCNLEGQDIENPITIEICGLATMIKFPNRVQQKKDGALITFPALRRL